ncbi:hydrogenase formation protein HypD [Clostridium beijerinckii]|uniref:Hydrogenase expression/formation protein HypD n=1 Tax=Clostridium beijerinckii TaxID=1520 RepID=A0AAX0AWF6_CLOBE|nr:hydrogenase formation protein HypD [Clostridium beijerinckii]NRT87072.1 hydrogenase expression/formation protein HypD [Clostridium beijerinckii]NYC72504.1 hydrogenase expression/formation protein HypD [Clostridium beijerinckii]
MNKEILIKNILNEIQKSQVKKFNVMEVCGTHTQALSKLGIRQLVNPNINLLSGPGCPVCVTPEGYIDAAIELLKNSNVILSTFGDMMRVSGTRENLIKQREKGKDIKVLYSPLDSIALAEENKDKEIVFLGVGFETTTPIIALAVKIAQEKNIRNISFLIGMKRMEPILHYILKQPNHNINGLMCPGHVAAVKGADYFKFIVEEYNIPAVIAGFEALDIASALYFLTEQQNKTEKSFENFYKTCVSQEGNKRANELMSEVFTYCEHEWRGIGVIKDSGFTLREKYKNYDASERFGINLSKTSEKDNIRTCACSEILLGKKLPNKCELFGKGCTPEHPIGPCMVSTEGSCSIFYKYRGVE